MQDFLAKFSVKFKIIGGFSLILLTWAGVALFVSNAVTGLEHEINDVVKETIPIQRKAMVLKNKIDKSGRVLGFYLLGKDKKLWLEFESDLNDAVLLVNEITQDLQTNKNSDDLKQNIVLMKDISLHGSTPSYCSTGSRSEPHCA